MFMKKTNLHLSTKQQIKNGALLLEVLDQDEQNLLTSL